MLKLLLDEDTQSRSLTSALRSAGHDVQTVNQAGLAGEPDSVVFQFAIANKRVVLTKNIDDFIQLASQNPTHSGIFLIYIEQKPKRHMSDIDLVDAIELIEAAHVQTRGAIHVLNAWRT